MKSRRAEEPFTQLRNVDMGELQTILERARSGPLEGEDYATLKSAVDTLGFLTRELEAKGASIERLRKLFFGGSSEKTQNVVPGASPSGKEKKAAPGKGHGRNGAAAYTGAGHVNVTHPTLNAGTQCPCCIRGKVYPMKEGQKLIRVKGMAPLAATVFECDRLRCNGCGEVFTAPAPPGIGEEKYDDSAAAMVAMLRYGAGVPFSRVERLQGALGIPLPASTQWDLVEEKAQALEPALDELMNQAAQGQVVHNDDTSMKVLELMAQTEEEAVAAGESEELAKRTGIRTTGVVSMLHAGKAVLFFTGRKHAGENLQDVLQRRGEQAPPPIQMCDGLSHNTDGEFESILSNCLSHARRYFVDVVHSFPAECKYVLETLRDVFAHDAETRAQGMSPAQRLALHQQKSGPLMDALKTWSKAQIDERRVEPNSGLGEALRYMLKRWAELTLFLRVEGAPLENNICERALKKAILHRKNSLFYKTLHGARVGDMYMSLIHTAELNGADPFHYLLTLMRNREAVQRQPDAWMPWNYPAP